MLRQQERGCQQMGVGWGLVPRAQAGQEPHCCAAQHRSAMPMQALGRQAVIVR